MLFCNKWLVAAILNPQVLEVVLIGATHIARLDSVCPLQLHTYVDGVQWTTSIKVRRVQLVSGKFFLKGVTGKYKLELLNGTSTKYLMMACFHLLSNWCYRLSPLLHLPHSWRGCEKDVLLISVMNHEFIHIWVVLMIGSKVVNVQVVHVVQHRWTEVELLIGTDPCKLTPADKFKFSNVLLYNVSRFSSQFWDKWNAFHRKSRDITLVYFWRMWCFMGSNKTWQPEKSCCGRLDVLTC